MDDRYSRIKKALDARVLPNDLDIHQAAFNLVMTNSGGVLGLLAALERWADTVLGPEENGNGEGRWADDGGGHVE